MLHVHAYPDYLTPQLNRSNWVAQHEKQRYSAFAKYTQKITTPTHLHFPEKQTSGKLTFTTPPHLMHTPRMHTPLSHANPETLLAQNREVMHYA